MVIGYNETAIVTPYDYSDCASFMEAAVVCMQECGVEERELYMFVNEAVNVKEITDKAIGFVKSWLSKILGIIQNVKIYIASKISKFKNTKPKEDVHDIEFSMEGYDYNNKFREEDISKFDFLGNHEGKGDSYVSGVLKTWTGKDNQSSCTVSDIKEHINDMVGKITITQDTKGYSFEDIKSYMASNKDMVLIKNIEKDAKEFADNRIKIINEFSAKQKNDGASADYIKEFNKDRLKETMKFASLNTNLVSALMAIVSEKIKLNTQLYFQYFRRY